MEGIKNDVSPAGGPRRAGARWKGGRPRDGGALARQRLADKASGNWTRRAAKGNYQDQKQVQVHGLGRPMAQDDSPWTAMR